MSENKDRFKIGITGLSEDMEDFILEQGDHYSNQLFIHHFWTSFWKVCTDMWVKGIDLSDKQLNIIKREYNKKRNIDKTYRIESTNKKEIKGNISRGSRSQDDLFTHDGKYYDRSKNKKYKKGRVV